MASLTQPVSMGTTATSGQTKGEANRYSNMKNSLLETNRACDRAQEQSSERRLLKKISHLKGEIQNLKRKHLKIQAIRKRNQEILLTKHGYSLPKEYSLVEAGDIIELKIFEMFRHLDCLRDETRQKENVFIHLHALQRQQWGELDDSQRISELINECQRISLKTREAHQINTLYKKIREEMIEDLSKFPSRLENAEERLRVQERDLRVLEGTALQARRRRNRVEEGLTKVQKNAKQANLRHAQVMLQSKRKDLKRSRSKGTQSFAAESEINWADNTTQEQNVIEHQYKNAMETLKSVTGLHSLQELEEHFVKQQDMSGQLETRAKELEDRLQELCLKKEALDDELHVLEMSIKEEKFQDMQDAIKSIDHEVAVCQKELDFDRARIAFLSPLLAEIRNSLRDIHGHLHPQETRDERVGMSTLSDRELLEVCECTLVAITQEIKENEMDVPLRTNLKGTSIKKDENAGQDTDTTDPDYFVSERDPAESDEDRKTSRGQMKKQAVQMAETHSKQKNTKKQLFKL